MAASTYFGSSLINKIRLGAIQIQKIYLGSNLVFSSGITPNPPNTYNDFYVGVGVYNTINNNYIDFKISIQPINN